jgi:hypothetical protein
VRSTYGHRVLGNAITGFVNSLPNKKLDYFTATADFLRRMYTLGSPADTRYFLDKTPRYHLIVDDLMEAFPEAKFIFLWRNPLAIAASMIQTWGNGKWNLYMFWIDLYRGLDALVSAFNRSGTRSIGVRYEDLAADPNREITKIMAYLGLESDGTILDAFSRAKPMHVPGRGDPSGQLKYQGVSRDSMDAWKKAMSNPFRKSWSREYLAWIGEERLTAMGFDLRELQADINLQQTNYDHLLSDIIRNALGKLYCRYAIESVRSNEPWANGLYFTQN